MATQLQLAEAQRLEQARISADATREALALWLAIYRPDESSSWRMLLDLLWSLVLRSRKRSAQSAVAYYSRSRQRAGYPQRFLPAEAPDPPVELVEATARITGARTYGRALTTGQQPDQAKQAAGVLLAGNMARIGLDAGRETILNAVQDDEDAIGWARVSDADPCAFCSMLVSRGPVFESRETASFQSHSHCACVAVPVFSRDEVWLEHGKDLYEQWKKATAGHSGKDALREWRRYWRSRDKAA
ncbi:hypothetical protein [Acrocarpospora sp. B8E8]|uniref:VG15 protein n=1 Tax=Acrocarpospora sp. B8E8 TaxID=3153572 RepID=UPI00325D315C